MGAISFWTGLMGVGYGLLGLKDANSWVLVLFDSISLVTGISGCGISAYAIWPR